MALSLHRHPPSKSALKRYLFNGEFRVASSKAKKGCQKDGGGYGIAERLAASTVLMMDGGVLDIGYMHYGEFWDHLKSIDPESETWCLVERTKTHNRVFFDLDLKTVKARPTVEAWELVASAVREAVGECFASKVDGDPECLDMYMSMCEPYDTGKGTTKAGVHLVMPRLVVSLEVQRLLRFAVVMRLRQVGGKNCGDLLGPDACEVDWDEVVDQEVYMGINKGGLRTVMSRKCKRCPKCCNDAKKGRDACLVCDATGYVLQGTYYRPVRSISQGNKAGGQWIDDRRVSRNHSIYEWCSDDDSGSFKVPMALAEYVRARSWELFGSEDGTHQWEVLRKQEKERARKNKLKRKEPDSPDNKLLQGACKELRLNRNYRLSRGFLAGKDVHDSLERMVRGLSFRKGQVRPFTNTHVDSKVVVLEPYSKTGRYAFLVTLSGDGCTWCVNKGSKHSSNRVWLHLKSSGFDLRCFSSKLNWQKKKPCKDVKFFVGFNMTYFSVYNALVKAFSKAKSDIEEEEEEQRFNFNNSDSDDESDGCSVMRPRGPLPPQPEAVAAATEAPRGSSEPASQEEQGVCESDLDFLFATQATDHDEPGRSG